MGPFADESADHVLKDLTEREQDGGKDQVQHGPDFAQHPEHQVCLQQEIYDQEHQRHQLIKSVQGISLIRGSDGGFPEVGPAKTRVERDVTRSDEKSGGGAEDQANAEGGAVVDELVAYGAVDHQNPDRGNDGGDLHRGERYPHRTFQRKPADGEDFTYLNDDVSNEEELHLSVARGWWSAADLRVGPHRHVPTSCPRQPSSDRIRIAIPARSRSQ